MEARIEFSPPPIPYRIEDVAQLGAGLEQSSAPPPEVSRGESTKSRLGKFPQTLKRLQRVLSYACANIFSLLRFVTHMVPWLVTR
jgi:hypothetical protein